MDFGAGFKNGVLLLALIVAVHIIMTKPDAIQNLMMHSIDVPGDSAYMTTDPPRGVAASAAASAAARAGPRDSDADSDLMRFVYADEDRGALDKFFRAKVADPRFAEGSEIIRNAHLKVAGHGVQDASVLRVPHDARGGGGAGEGARCSPVLVSGMDTFAAGFSCPV